MYFFRQFKLFAKRITDFVRSSSDPMKLNDRIFIISMLSFINNQLCAPVFRPMLIYAWQKSGYEVDEHISTFKNVLQVNFHEFYRVCDQPECEDSSFCICAHCNKAPCIKHTNLFSSC